MDGAGAREADGGTCGAGNAPLPGAGAGLKSVVTSVVTRLTDLWWQERT